MLGIPEEVVTRRAPETATYYVLKQTHEPLFRRDDGQNYSSRLLRSWRRDLMAKEYLFCPDTSLKFDDKNSFGPDFFQEYLSGVTKRYSPDFKLTRVNDCSAISFPLPRKGYLDALTLYENAPTIPQSRGGEMGLGPFYVDSVSSDKIVLLRKTRIKNGYNEIVIREFYPAKRGEYKYSEISDFNKLTPSDVPEKFKAGYVGFNNIQLRSNVVMINHPDRAVRRQVYNCLDVDKFRRAFLPGSDEFYDLGTVLPVGVPGAIPGKPTQVCREAPALKGREVVFYNHRSGNREQLDRFAADFMSRSGLSLKIVHCTPQELVRVLHKFPRPFNLTALALDTVYPDYLTFFDCFANKDGYFDFPLPRISELYALLSREDDPQEKILIVKEILEELSKEAVVLPLGQDIKKFYYPPTIKNLNIGRGFMEYPEVAELRW